MVEDPAGIAPSTQRKGRSRTLRAFRFVLIALAALGIAAVVGRQILVMTADAELRRAREAVVRRNVDLPKPYLGDPLSGPVPDPIDEALASLPDPDGPDTVLMAGVETGFLALEEADRLHVRSMVKRGAGALRVVREARLTGPIPVTDDISRLHAPTFHDNLASLIGLSAEVAAADGDSRGAMEAVHDLLALASAHREQPYLNSWSIRRWALRTAIRTVGRCVDKGTPRGEREEWLTLLPDQEEVKGEFDFLVRSLLSRATAWSEMGIHKALDSLG